MKKKSALQHSKNIHTFKIIAIFLLLILALASKFSGKSNVLQVLGSTIGPNLLADKGSDDSGGSHSGGSGSTGGDSGSGGSSGGGGSSGSDSSRGSGETSGDRSGSSGRESHDSGSSAGTVQNNTAVICTGPDGKQFKTDYKHCAEINNGWHTPVNFTVITTPISPKEKPEPSHTPKPTTTVKPVEIGKTETIELKVEDGHNAAEIKHENEAGEEIETEDALEKVNEALKETETEVHASKSGFVVKKGETEAEAHLPISVNPSTGELKVTTKTGTKTVTIFPDEAVNNILNNGTISNVSSETRVIELTELNSEPVFKVEGETHKNFLGLTPMNFSKTAFVSARTGAILRIDETILNRILELLSF